MIENDIDLKMLPSDQIQTIFNLRTYQLRNTPLTNILKGLFMEIYIENGKIK